MPSSLPLASPATDGRRCFLTLGIAGGTLTARIAGPGLGQRESQVVAGELNDAITSAGRRLRALVLDMREVRSVSSMGLGMCIDARNTAHAAGAPTFVLGLGPELTDLFRMMRTDRLCRLVRDEEELRGELGRL